ncbi:hypothetical protein [Massilia sp. CFBP9026]|uniref:hypothetical protein n=1 Tax=Massilia sp. CFBP9026 TaxID=3096536 RepID=UPI002A6B23E4|nr:hypothetical protein [Massilia sp. CFBP9026]MDY0961173.1 hypothetical protein [Massilia sp. CFBP9026]
MTHLYMLRFDGVYYGPTENGVRKIFRFYPDETVIEATTAAGLSEIVPWLRKELFTESQHSIGRYRRCGPDIFVAATNAPGYGTIEYSGMLVSPDEIRIESRSLINGNQARYTVHFVPLGLEG